jgi:ABC-type multidrug transport system fused ATPase/permease subunit
MLPLFGVYFMAVLRLLPGVSTISADWLQMVGRMPYAQSLHDALVQDTYRLPPGRVAIDRVGLIRFEDVAYRYPSRDLPALAAVSFTIEPRRMTAVVGESGSGKSTVATLLVRSIMPSGGRITVDGVPLSDIRPESWLAKIAYVSQEAFIFNASVRDNIRFGGEFSEEAVVRAAEMADAHGFIAAMPQGYDTPVGDRGVKLSGGQRQRLALARAILRNPELLILDEATSALDNVAEQEVQHAIDSLSRTHTVLVIAHRLNTIKDADRIVVLKEGEVVEAGAHDELLNLGGEYARLYRRESQANGEAHGGTAT